MLRLLLIPLSATEIKKDACYCSTEFCKATHVAEKFLFPFMIEFSLVASILLFITWNNAGKKAPPQESVVKPSYKFYNNYTGLIFKGFLKDTQVCMFKTFIVIIMLNLYWEFTIEMQFGFVYNLFLWLYRLFIDVV